MEQTTPEKPPPSNVNYRNLVVVSIVVIAVQIVAGYVVYSSFGSWSDRSDFGEMFGVVNTLFSGLAFSGIIYAIFLQRQELELQRHEYKMTAEAQEKSQESLKEQVHQLALQRRLSVMPSLLTYVEASPDGDYLRLFNIGNGIAINISIDPVEVLSPIFDSFEPALITFGTILMLNPKGNERVPFSKITSEGLENENENSLDLLTPAAHHNVEVHVRFQDIEGNKYIQTTQMGKDGYILGFVQLIGSSTEPKSI